MAERRLTINELVKLTGYSRRQLRGFCNSGLLIPKNVGNGSGQWWFYNFRQLLGLMYAAQFAEALSRRQAGKVMSFVMNYTEAELQRHFRAGRRILFPFDKVLKLEKNEAAEGSEFDLSLMFDAAKDAVQMIADRTGARVVSRK